MGTSVEKYEEKLRLLRELYPSLTEEELRRAEFVIDQYLRIGWRIYARQHGLRSDLDL
jgi:hypothetical protein